MVPIGDITAGKEYALFKVPTSKTNCNLGALICFEDLFPEISREFAKKGANILVNITNDAWYKFTSAPYQHLAASVFRAVENRLPLARAANTGISCFILPSGKIASRIQDSDGKDIFVTGIAQSEVNISNNAPTLYCRFGDYFPFICFIFVIYCLIKRKTQNA